METQLFSDWTEIILLIFLLNNVLAIKFCHCFPIWFDIYYIKVLVSEAITLCFSGNRVRKNRIAINTQYKRKALWMLKKL